MFSSLCPNNLVQSIYLNKPLKHVSQWQEGNEAIILVGENNFLQETEGRKQLDKVKKNDLAKTGIENRSQYTQ